MQASVDTHDGADPGFRAARFIRPRIQVERRGDGTIILRSDGPEGKPRSNFIEHIRYWAELRPARTFLAERGTDNQWIKLTYKEAWRRISAIGQALVDRGQTAERPVAILSQNSIAHAMIAFGAMSVGIPAAPISPQYSRLEGGLERLRHIGEVLRPAAVFAQQLSGYESVRQIPSFAGAEWIVGENDKGATSLDDLQNVRPESKFESAFEAVTTSTVAKIIFTSGSTGLPKGVMNTHGNICSSAVAVGEMFPWDDEDYVLVDWLPWHHSLGGTNNVSNVIYNGGTMYIDRGKPLSSEISETVRNLKEISPTFVQGVPAAFAALADVMEADEELCESFFRRLCYVSYSGASLPQEVWSRLQALSIKTIGKKIAFLSAWGATEAGPGISSTCWYTDGHGEVGVPLPGLEVKLVPLGDRFEARVRGAAVTPGYWRCPELTAAAFDEEGFYKVGDAMRLVDANHPEQGMRFAGRASENFKLVSGTFVNVGALRLAVLSATNPLLQDVVVAGEGRDDVRILAWPSPSGCANWMRNEIALHTNPDVQNAVREALSQYNAANLGSSRRVAAFHLLAEPPSLGKGETTDKGYINQRGVLAARSVLVEDLYARSPPGHVIVL
ncbi:feruloyl-CoA synthase [Bradyrhizobium sp. USDA 4011]